MPSPQIEREAVIALYESTDGDNWTDNSGWKNGDDFAAPGTECGWKGVYCYDDRVNQLFLENNNLTGAILAELGNLTNLIDLSLGWNKLTDEIPITLMNLTDLE